MGDFEYTIDNINTSKNVVVKINEALSYKNYIGSMEYSVDDDCWHGKILYTDDLFTYESDNFNGLLDSFRECVDNL